MPSFAPFLSLPSWFRLIPLTRHCLPCKAVWLTCLRPTVERPCSQTRRVQKWLRRFCHTLRPAITQRAQPAFIFRWKHAESVKVKTLHKLALSLACTRCIITLNYSNKTKPSPSHGEEGTALSLTIQVLTSSTLLICACHRSDIPLSWIMEKSEWNTVCDSLAYGSNTTTKKTSLKTKSETVISFFFQHAKCLKCIKAFHQHARTLCRTANGDRLLWCPYRLYAHKSEMAWVGKNRRITQYSKELYRLTVVRLSNSPGCSGQEEGHQIVQLCVHPSEMSGKWLKHNDGSCAIRVWQDLPETEFLYFCPKNFHFILKVYSINGILKSGI